MSTDFATYQYVRNTIDSRLFSSDIASGRINALDFITAKTLKNATDILDTSYLESYNDNDFIIEDDVVKKSTSTIMYTVSIALRVGVSKVEILGHPNGKQTYTSNAQFQVPSGTTLAIIGYADSWYGYYSNGQIVNTIRTSVEITKNTSATVPSPSKYGTIAVSILDGVESMTATITSSKGTFAKRTFYENGVIDAFVGDTITFDTQTKEYYNYQCLSLSPFNNCFSGNSVTILDSDSTNSLLSRRTFGVLTTKGNVNVTVTQKRINGATSGSVKWAMKIQSGNSVLAEGNTTNNVTYTVPLDSSFTITAYKNGNHNATFYNYDGDYGTSTSNPFTFTANKTGTIYINYME